MSEMDYIDRSEKLSNLQASVERTSPDNFRKLAFYKLLEASKKHRLQKIQGKNEDILEKTKQEASKLYSDYNRAKNLTTARYT